MSRLVEQLAFLCERLATGTGWMQQRAWEQLTSGNALWGHCQAAVKDPSSLDGLERCFEYLAGIRVPALVSAVNGQCPGPAGRDPASPGTSAGLAADAEEMETLLRAVRRLVAAAGVAALIRSRGCFPAWEAQVLRWAYRAVTLGLDAPPELLLEANLVRDSDAAVARRCFHTLVAFDRDGWEPGPAQAAVLQFLGDFPALWVGGVPILLTHRAREEGQVVRLALGLDAEGFGSLFPAPRMLRSFDREWHDALTSSWRRVPLPAGADVQWEIDGDAARVTGRSAQAAFEVALTLLAGGGVYDRGCAVSATADDAGRLGPVQGLVGAYQRAGPKLLAARPAGVRRVVLSPEDYRGLPTLARDELRAQGLELIEAATVAQARDHVSGLATGIAEYLGSLERWSEREETLPAYFGGRDPTGLYVEPDVILRGQAAESEPVPGGPDPGADGVFGESSPDNEWGCPRRLPFSEQFSERF
jgi:hypothetical protein